MWLPQPSFTSASPAWNRCSAQESDSRDLPQPQQSRRPADRLTDSQVPNEPDTNDKNFVFLHGYNVNPDQARGAFADMFKRLYWSGSHAKFYGVTWNGYESQARGIWQSPPTTTRMSSMPFSPRRSSRTSSPR